MHPDNYTVIYVDNSTSKHFRMDVAAGIVTVEGTIDAPTAVTIISAIDVDLTLEQLQAAS